MQSFGSLLKFFLFNLNINFINNTLEFLTQIYLISSILFNTQNIYKNAINKYDKCLEYIHQQYLGSTNRQMSSEQNGEHHHIEQHLDNKLNPHWTFHWQQVTEHR